MKKFRDLAVKYKILSGYFAVLSIFLALGAYFIYVTVAISIAGRRIELRSFSGVELITTLQVDMERIGHLSHDITNMPQEAGVVRAHRELEIHVAKFRVLLSEYKDLVKKEPLILRKALESGDIFEKYHNLIDERIEALIKGKVFLQNIEEYILAGQLSNNLRELRDEDVSRLSIGLSRIDRLAFDARNSYLAMLILAAALSVLIACAIAKRIVGPIKDLVIAQRKLSNGSLDYKIEIKSRDEVGTLQGGFMAMAQRLKQACGELQKEKDGLDARVKERTRELEQSQEYLRDITDGVEEGIMLLDDKFKVLWANRRIMEISGLKEGEVIDNYCYSVTHRLNGPCKAPYDICPIVDVLKTGKSITEVHTHYDKDGNEFYAEVSAYPVRDDKGEIKQFIHISRDVTEKIKLENKLKTFAQDLQRANQELKAAQAGLIQSAKMASIGQLSAGLAHEINNPLTGVLNNVQLIKMMMEQEGGSFMSDAEFKELLNIIEESATRCKNITQSLLDFSHISKVYTSRLSANELIEKVGNLVAYELRLQNITLRTELSPDLPFIQGNPQLLQQVFMNLITNARWAIKKKAQEKGGLITIKTEYQPQKNIIAIYITDTGVGMSDEVKKRIFEPFFTTKDVGEGTGLGLSVIYGIIKEHKGAIEVDSRENAGATFKIYLPAVENK